MEDEDENFKCQIANEMTKRLIGYSISFEMLNQKIQINEYISVTLYGSLSVSDGNDGYYQISFKYFEDYSFPIPDKFSGFGMSIDRKAEEFGMKLWGLVKYGEVYVNTFFNSLKLTVNVFKLKGSEDELNISLIIKIDYPPDNVRERRVKRYKQEVKEYYRDEDSELLIKAFQVGATAVGAVILAKIIKGGIGAILAGPFGAIVGFAT